MRLWLLLTKTTTFTKLTQIVQFTADSKRPELKMERFAPLMTFLKLHFDYTFELDLVIFYNSKSNPLGKVSTHNHCHLH